MSTVAQIDMKNKTIDTFEIDTVKKEESYTEFLSRRCNSMASMIGYMGSMLGQVDITASTSLEYFDNNTKLLKGALKEVAIKALEAQVQLEKEWMEMNSYNDPNYVGNKFSVEKINRATEKIEALKTLVF